MASSIEWTNESWNVTTGCTHISEECNFCYAEKETKRLMHNPNFTKYRKGFDVVVEHPDTLLEPFKWKSPRTVFVDSMADLFHKDVSLEFIKKVFKVMNDTPQHTYQILTKRHNLLEKYSKELTWTDNIWAGVSVGNQIATRRIESLVKCDAKHKFLSVEPLIEEINDINVDGIDWVIVGGESGGNDARPMEKEWVEKIQNECLNKNVPFFFKQWGKTRNNPNQNDPTINDLHRYHSKGGSQLNGKTFWANPTVANDSSPSVELFGEEHLVMDEHHLGLVTIWELKSYLPFPDENLYKKLKEDIRENGLNDPILYIDIFDGKKLVIEGHTRLRAMLELKKRYIPEKKIIGTFRSLDEVKLWMVKHQLQRRNLSTVEKVNLAYHSKSTIEKLAKENLSKGGKSNFKNGEIGKSIEIQKIDTYQEIANIAGVGRTTVFRYSQILDNASQTTLGKLNKGEISIGSAYTSIKNKIGKTVEIKKKPLQSKVNNITEILNYEDCEKAMLSNEIDAVIMVKSDGDLKSLKFNTKLKIGVYNWKK